MIITKALSDLSPNEYRACRNLNLRDEGYMREALSLHRRRQDSYAIMMWDGSVNLGSLTGWALLVPTKVIKPDWGISKYGTRKSKYVVQIYVRKTQRHKGYGSTLMAEAQKLDPAPYVWPHDKASGKFFGYYKVHTDIAGRNLYIKQGKQYAS